MRVVLRNPHTPDGRHVQSLTVGREYTVLGMSADTYRLLSDAGEPLLYETECFEVLDPGEPALWVSVTGDEGERYAGPPGWGVPGFYEAWHDGDSLVRQVFAVQLAFWYPRVPAPKT